MKNALVDIAGTGENVASVVEKYLNPTKQVYALYVQKTKETESA